MIMETRLLSSFLVFTCALYNGNGCHYHMYVTIHAIYFEIKNYARLMLANQITVIMKHTSNVIIIIKNQNFDIYQTLPGGHPGETPKSDLTKCIHVVRKSPGGVLKGKHSGLQNKDKT